MNPVEFATELRRLSDLLDQALTYLKEQTVEYSVAEDAYRLAKAKALLNAEGTVSEKEAHSVLATSEERRRAHLAEGMRQAALEAVRSRRAQLSAIQTLINAFKQELEFAQYGPDSG